MTSKPRTNVSPCWTLSRNTLTYDVTQLLAEGRNAISVLLGNGFFNVQRMGRYSKLQTSFGPPQMISGQEEAIAVFGHDPRIYESTVKEFVKDKNGSLKAVKIVKLSWEKDPASGRMKMSEVPGSEQTLPAEIVLIAAGFLGSQKYVTDAFHVDINERSNVKTGAGAVSYTHLDHSGSGEAEAGSFSKGNFKRAGEGST